MLALIVCCFIGLSVVLAAEYFHKKQLIVTETTRKSIHITHGLILLALIYLTQRWIIVSAEVIFFLMAIISRRYKLFKSQHDVGRKTWGEFYFPAGVILILILGAPRWVFILAILHLGFADAAAALVGKRYGTNNTYTVFGQKKSIAGSFAFFVTSVILVGSALLISPEAAASSSNIAIYLLPLMTTVAENLGAFGSDNLLIPLAILALLG
ncbi:MAG TPA: hypothetical protein VLF39_02650 [Candidatus Saccharimonadales bacterium]|nr:hypothetical protein [Candidatus Saccharimonadales bacterium]